MLRDLAHVYSEVFAPELFLLVCVLGLVVYEWRQTTPTAWSALVLRFTTVGIAWGLAFLLAQVPDEFLTDTPYWISDLFAGLGIAVGFLFIATVWRRNGWGRTLPELAIVLIALTVAHSILVPFWDVSSHVAYTATPVGYLLTISRRFFPLILVPSGMVFSRPLTGAHTWIESIGGGVLALIFIAGFLWYQTREASATSESQ